MDSFDEVEVEFEFRVPEIDGDHWVILNLTRAAQAAAAAGDRRQSEGYLNRLVAFSAGHFVREELLLESWKYPDLEEHSTEHAEIQQRAKVVKDACGEVKSREAYEKCCETLVSILENDVRRGDHKLRAFFENAGLTVSPS